VSLVTFTETVLMEATTCAHCGVVFAMPKHLLQEFRDSLRGFYCPHGHSLSYHKPTIDSLRQELAEKARQLTAAKCETLNEKQQRERVEAEKAKVERKLKRVQRGVCPCCNRTFTNLQRHMSTKHPEAPRP